MKSPRPLLLLAAALAATVFPSPLAATNGMNMEGYGGKLGLLYRPTHELAVGLTYHAQTSLSDLKADNSSVRFQLNVPGMGRIPQALAGDIRVRDFEWPAMLGLGVAYNPAGRWSFAADVREVFWSDVMQNFNMRFTAAGVATNGNFAGQTLDATLFQRWHNQFIAQGGATFVATRELTVRAGVNLSSNPIPDRFLNCLFPATIERHLTAGFSWHVNDPSGVDCSAIYGFTTTATNGYGITIAHRQLNTQLMYSYLF